MKTEIDGEHADIDLAEYAKPGNKKACRTKVFLLVLSSAVVIAACFPGTDFTVSNVKKRSITYNVQAVSTATGKGIEGVKVTSPESNPRSQGARAIDSFADPLETPKGYNFVGWFDQNGNQVTSLSHNYFWDYNRTDLTLTARFEPIVYTVSFASEELNEGRIVPKVPSRLTYTVEDENISLTDIEAEGYAFQGWHEKDSDEILKQINVSSCRDYSLQASWSKAVFYTIFYSSNVDESISTVDYGSNRHSYTTEDSFELEPPTAYGYNFLGWRDENGKAISSTITRGTTGHKNFVAQFEPVVYTLTFDPAGGSVSTPKRTYTIEDGAISYPTASDVNRLGYAFAGWVDEEGNAVSGQDAQSSGNKTLTAKWTLKSYEIHYSQTGINYAPSAEKLRFDNPLSYTVEDTIELNSPSVEGYKFLGWFDKAGNALPSTIAAGTTGEKNYVAKFEPVAYALTFDPAGGSVNTPKRTYTIEDGAISYPGSSDVTRSGYKFLGWADEDGNIVFGQGLGCLGDKTFTARWSALTYSISYSSPSIDAKGLSSVDYGANPTSYTVEGGAIQLAEPKANGYRFLGWKLNGSALADGRIPAGTVGNLALEATWEPITYTVTFDPAGGSVGTAKMTYTVEDGAISYPDSASVTRPGYDFLGWADGDGNAVSGQAAGSTGDRALTARWGVLTYSISYSSPSVDSKGVSAVDYGANPTSYTVEGGAIQLAEPKANGYRFLGWKLNGSALADGRIPAGTVGNLALEATWEPITYSVSYQLNGGTNSKTNLSSYNVEGGVITLSNPTRANYVFEGWIDGDGNIVTSLDGYNGKNTTLTATWGLIGDGTVTNPYQIYDQNQLAMIGEDSDACYILMSDITVTGNWTAISCFSGSLDGNSHIITYGAGLVAPSNGKLAIFDTLTGSVKDLTFNGTIGSSSSRLLAEQYGALAIDFQGGANSIVNVASRVTAYLQSNGDSAVAGGIVGTITSGYIRKCTNYGRLDVYCSGNGADVGGIAGIGVSGTISDCKNASGAIVYANCKTARVGGIIGQRKWPSGTSIYASTKDIATAMNEGNAQGYKQDGYTVNEGDILGYDAAFDLDKSTLTDSDKNAKPKLDPDYSDENTGGYFYVAYIRTQTGFLWVVYEYYAIAWQPYQDGSCSGDTSTYLDSKDYKQI